MPEGGIEQYWKEDARRMNSSCELAKRLGIVVDVNEGDPEPLNPDGSLALSPATSSKQRPPPKQPPPKPTKMSLDAETAERVMQMTASGVDVVVEMAVHRVPKGYTQDKPLNIAGKDYLSGQFVPGEELAKASPEQRKVIEGATPTHAGFAPTSGKTVPVVADEESLKHQKALRERIEKIGSSLFYRIARVAHGHGHSISLTPPELKKVLDYGVVGFVSAGKNIQDPADAALTDADIEKRHARLRDELVQDGFRFVNCQGSYGGPEKSFMVMVPEVKRQELVDIGEHFHQNSVLWSDSGNNELIYTSGPDKGKRHRGSGWSFVPEAEDFFTEFETNTGEKIKFSLNLDFDKPALMSMLKRYAAMLKKNGAGDPASWLRGLIEDG